MSKTLKEEFEFFMSKSFPTMKEGDSRWDEIKLIFYSGSFITSICAEEGISFFGDSIEYINKYLLERMHNGIDKGVHN